MKREIKFRGKRIDNGDWVYGLFTNKKIGNLIVPVIEVYHEWDSGDYMESNEVDGDTVGEFTGLRDKNGKEIYEGDIVKYGTDKPNPVIFYNQMFCVPVGGSEHKTHLHIMGGYNKWEVIGNIYENPELVK